MDFSGETVFVNPDGSIAGLADDQKQLVFAELDMEQAGIIRQSKQYIPL